VKETFFEIKKVKRKKNCVHEGKKKKIKNVSPIRYQADKYLQLAASVEQIIECP
jgi:hypothetical protein